jgi:hypothetical protein
MPDTPELPAGEAAPNEEVFESQLEAIQIKVEAFEGPLDLLVHLIKKNQMNVYDIQISVITRQYLEYLNLMQELNLDVASEFLVMAATLIHIKSKQLLPRPETAIRATRWSGACSSTRSSRRRRSCCTTGKRCAARSGRGRIRASRRLPARITSPRSKSTCLAC